MKALGDLRKAGGLPWRMSGSPRQLSAWAWSVAESSGLSGMGTCDLEKRMQIATQGGDQAARH